MAAKTTQAVTRAVDQSNGLRLRTMGLRNPCGRILLAPRPAFKQAGRVHSSRRDAWEACGGAVLKGGAERRGVVYGGRSEIQSLQCGSGEKVPTSPSAPGAIV